ncbi:hypothetical protein ZWY2020_019852 [Hordeum vulgare]|nr:hypothetical protein ZWY2020_019852 [Hordeum vulgare]
MEPVAAKGGSEYRRVEPEEEEEELDEPEWERRAEAGSRRRKTAKRYVFTCALFASLNAILLGYVKPSQPSSPSLLLLLDEIAPAATFAW